jgi:predicted ATP-grasp superfamily ATP-dependent carboligase
MERRCRLIEFDSFPELTDPIMIAAFEGWNDAGDAASGAVDHLAEVWSATPIASIDPEDYYDFQVNRPTVAVDTDGRRRITWPTTTVSLARVAGQRDVVLVRGVEPSMRWRSFAEEVVDLAHDLGISLIVSLGAFLNDSPHTRPVPMVATSSDSRLITSLTLEQSRYEGPTGIVGVFQEAADSAGFPAVSLWAAVPHYVAQPPCPKATVALLSTLSQLIDRPIPLRELPEQAVSWERGVNELAEEDSEVAEYVKALEEAKDTTELPQATGEAIAKEFERYLRHRPTDG